MLTAIIAARRALQLNILRTLIAAAATLPAKVERTKFGNSISVRAAAVLLTRWQQLALIEIRRD